MLIDTHAHLWWPSYEGDLDEVLERARAAGVEKIICPGTNAETSKQAIELAKKYPGVIYAGVGVHPEEVLNFGKVRPSPPMSMAGWALPSRSDLAGSVAVGEIGIDLYTEEMRGKLSEQKELFRVQCEMAVKLDLPVIVHTRQSLVETLEVLGQLPKMPRGQFHCFSHDEIGLKQVLKRGFYVSFCGNITWSKRVARLVPLVPIDRLLLETDSPFMLPGGRNDPGNVTITAQIIADLQGLTLQALGEQTTNNAQRLFKL
ncbi:MAG: Hydrolase, TatD family [Microgenomates group bacterium GW2011_GWA2_46_16]|nr:MAG: Hydrolase, TatD family [Microgenomates group bacterium GW2011_GWA2_46_16]